STMFSLSSRILLQTTVGLLALVGTSLVVDRLVDGRTLRVRLNEFDGRLREVLQRSREIEAAGLDRLVIPQRDLPPPAARLIGSKRIFVSGGSLLRLINEYKRLFEELADAGCDLRFLMVDPECDAEDHLSRLVSYESHSVSNYRAQARDAAEGLQSLVN